MEIKEVLAGEFHILFDRIMIAGDGGTIYFEVVGKDSICYSLYLDRRMDTLTEGHIFSGFYPDDDRAVDLGRNLGIEKQLDDYI